jgi:hypothetical protein
MNIFGKTFISAAAALFGLAGIIGSAQAGPYSYSINNGTAVSINEISKVQGAGYYSETGYYGYGSPNGASSNTPDNLETSNTISLFLFRDANNDRLSLFQLMDRANDGDRFSVTTGITSSGLAGSGQSFIVRDDPADSSYLWNDATGSASISHVSFSCCTDGFVLGYLPDAGGDSWDINLSFPAFSGLNTLRI